jgi:carbon-monoxide dehydrogenase medium subunit
MRYEAPSTTKEAVALLAKAKGTAHVLAGGTDLLVRMKGGFVEPDLVVDIKRIKTMREIRKTASGFSVGAAVSAGEMNENAALKKAWPGVVEAAGLIGSKQIQSRCTIVGNLCNASPAADSVPAMVAAGAKVVISGARGKRTIPVEQLPAGPGRTNLKKGEIVEAVFLPKRPPRSADAYLRFIPRTEMDIAVVSAGVNLTLDSLMMQPWPRWRKPVRPPAGRSMTSGEQLNSEPRWLVCLPGGPQRSPTGAQEESDVWSSRINHDQRRQR